MPYFDAGKNIIDAYMKGVALRQQNEAKQAQLQIATQNQEFKRDQLKQAWDISEKRIGEQSRYHDAQIEKLKAEAKAAAIKERHQLAVDLRDGLREPDPDNPGEFRSTQLWQMREAVKENERLKAEGKGRGQISTAEGMIPVEVKKQDALLPGQVEKARQVSQAQVPAHAALAGIVSDLTRTRQKEQNVFTAQQNEANRALRRQIAADNLAFKREKGLAGSVDEEENIAATIDGIKNGDITTEDLVKFPAKDRKIILSRAYKEKAFPITVKDSERFDESRAFAQYIKIGEELKERIRGKSVLEAKTDKVAVGLEDQMKALAKIFSNNVSGDRSFISDREVPRIAGGTVSINPGGWLSVIPGSAKTNYETNQKRLTEFVQDYKANVNSRLGRMNPEMRQNILKKYGLNEIFDRYPDKKDEPKKKGKNSIGLPDRFVEQ